MSNSVKFSRGWDIKLLCQVSNFQNHEEVKERNQKHQKIWKPIRRHYNFSPIFQKNPDCKSTKWMHQDAHQMKKYQIFVIIFLDITFWDEIYFALNNSSEPISCFKVDGLLFVLQRFTFNIPILFIDMNCQTLKRLSM